MITQDQVLACTDKQQLTDWCAEYCMGWLDNNDYWMEPFQATEDDVDFQPIHKSDYTPLANTEKGKAQCFDLMVEYEMTVDAENNLVHWHEFSDSDNPPVGYTRKEPLQTAIVKSALCAQIVKIGETK